MPSFSPKIEIINHFDNLINNVDIDIELCIEKCNDKQILGELLESSSVDRKDFRKENDCFNVKLHNTIESPNNNIWPESTKVIDYLNQVRIRTIEELRKAQDDYLEYYKINSSGLKSQLTDKNSIDELRSELFAEKFYFQVNLTQPTKSLWHFNLFTFVTDFYMSQSDINSLEKLINAENEPFCRKSPVFDQKMVLICLLYKSFIENLSNFPSHFVHVRKQDVLNIESIVFKYDYVGVELTNSSTIDLSRLVNLDLNSKLDLVVEKESAEIKIEGLTSLKTLIVGIDSLEVYLSIRNLSSLKLFDLVIPRMNEDNTTRIFDQLQNIQDLKLSGNLYYFNLDSFVNLNLKSILLCGNICDGFNLNLFKNISNQLDEVSLFIPEIKYEEIIKMFNGHNFTNLHTLIISRCKVRKIEKKFMDQFPNLRKFCMVNCKVEKIEDNAFSNLKELTVLDLSENLLESIYKRDFSELVNLEYFVMIKNRLKIMEEGIFSHMKNIGYIDLSYQLE